MTFSRFYFILTVFCILFASPEKLRSQNISEQIHFISYLVDNSEYRDAIFLIHRVNSEFNIMETQQKDSLNYLHGWAFYSMRQLDSSSFYFGQVSIESAFYHKSKLFQAFENIYLGKYDEAKTILTTISFEINSDLQNLGNFELAGIALLQRDYNKFSELSGKFDSGYYPASPEQEKFLEYNKKLQAIKLKSPLLAGFLSAIIPGMGKFYAGYQGQAIAAFLPPALLALVAVENLLKAGLLSPQFIIFGGLFSVFYAGNIWGSVLSVKTKYDEQFYEIDQDILLDLHLPLRRVFN